MAAYELWSRMNNYKGGYGHGIKEKIHDITANRFEQEFFGPEELYNHVANDQAGQYVTTMGLGSRVRRDMAIDAVNPKQKLPEDQTSSVLLNTVPMFAWSHPPDATLPEDFKGHDQIKLFQQSFFNAYRQEQLFNDPRFFDDYMDPENNSSKQNVSNKGLPASQVYNMDGSAAGRITNFLGGEKRDESYRENSVESMTAF